MVSSRKTFCFTIYVFFLARKMNVGCHACDFGCLIFLRLFVFIVYVRVSGSSMQVNLDLCVCCTSDSVHNTIEGKITECGLVNEEGIFFLNIACDSV